MQISQIRLHLSRTDEIGRPIDLARLLTLHGLSLKRAHAILNRIVADEVVAVRLWSETPEALVDAFGALGVEAHALAVTEANPQERTPA